MTGNTACVTRSWNPYRMWRVTSRLGRNRLVPDHPGTFDSLLGRPFGPKVRIARGGIRADGGKQRDVLDARRGGPAGKRTGILDVDPPKLVERHLARLADPHRAERRRAAGAERRGSLFEPFEVDDVDAQLVRCRDSQSGAVYRAITASQALEASRVPDQRPAHLSGRSDHNGAVRHRVRIPAASVLHFWCQCLCSRGQKRHPGPLASGVCWNVRVTT